MRFLLSLPVLLGLVAPHAQAQLQRQVYGEGDVVAVDVKGSSMLVSRVEQSLSHYSVHWLELENGRWEEQGIVDEDDVDMGSSLGIDADWAAVGEPFWNERGRVRLCHRQGDKWERADDLELNVDGVRPDEAHFGAGVELEYPWLLVHASTFRENDWGPSHGAVFFYEHVEGEWVYRLHIANQDAFTYSISMEDDIAVVGPFLYRLQNGAWVQAAELETWRRGCGGSIVSTDGERVAVARSARDCGTTQSPGAIYIYEADGAGTWALQDSVVGPAPTDGNWGNRFINLQGSVLTVEERVYVEEGGVWNEAAILRGSHSASLVGRAIVHDSGDIIGVSSYVYVFDLTRSTESPSLIAPSSNAFLSGIDSLVVTFTWEPVQGAKGYVLVSHAHYYPPVVEELGGETTSHTLVYHFPGDGAQSEQIDVRWQVSAVLEEGIGRPSVRSFNGVIETSYDAPPPFDGFDLTRFTPADVGNRWEYRWTEVQAVEDDESTSTGYESFEILPDTTIGDSTFTVVHVRRLDEQHRLIQSKTCAYSTTEQVLLDASSEDARCERPYVLYKAGASADFQADQTVEIAGEGYDVDALARRDGQANSPGSTEGGHWHYEWAADIGMLHYSYGSWSSIPPDYISHTREYEADLIYAEVNGVRYGQSVVRSESGELPLRAAMAFESLYPNPVGDVLHLRINMSSPGRTTLDLYDVTGRRIHTVSAQLSEDSADLTIDLPPGASGLLLLRATDSEGNTATAQVIRIAR